MADKEPLEAEHMVIVGDSGSGKTTLLKGIHSRIEYPSIFVNHRTKSPWKGISGKRCAGRKSLRSAPEDFDSWSELKINYRSEGQTPTQMVATCISFAREMKQKTGYGAQICIPEIANFMSDDKTGRTDNPVKWAMHEGRDEGIKIVGDTQDPQELDYTPLKQSRYIVWVGPPHRTHQGFLRYYRIDEEELPGEKFVYHVLDGSMKASAEPVEIGKTDRFE